MINDQGISLIKSFEGLRLEAYPDPATGGAPWTVGFGCTDGVTPGMKITEAEALQMLHAHLAPLETQVKALVKVPLTDNQFAALVVLAFNIGIGNLRHSTLLEDLNKKNYIAAADQFLAWDRAAGKRMVGLARRRQAERKLFLTA